jgi:nicotinamidase-related amidase
VLKPKHSGFFGTSLDLLLEYLQVRTLVIAGLTGNMCVQFTAQDAYLRDFHLFVPADCTASLTSDANDVALRYMREVLKVDTQPSEDLDLDELVNL